jgi:plasmanylethanolamine desaturase
MAALTSYSYSPVFRTVEILSVAAFAGLVASQSYRLLGFWWHSPFLAALTFVGAWVFADFVSGFFHWAGDTWATPELPVLGQTVVRTFWEHHRDPLIMTRHDWVETNATNCLISLPMLIFCQLRPGAWGHSFVFFLALWVCMTNQIHKWAHQHKRPGWVTFLQRWRLINGPKHHSIHHVRPHMKHYCITTGWLNVPLNAIGFFRSVEWLVIRLTGFVPRQELDRQKKRFGNVS